MALFDPSTVEVPKTLGEALNTVNLATVDLRRLSQRNGDTEFLTDLIRTEILRADRVSFSTHMEDEVEGVRDGATQGLEGIDRQQPSP